MSEHTLSHYERGSTYLENDDFDRALEEFLLHLNQNKRDEDAYCAVFSLLDKKNALQDFSKVLNQAAYHFTLLPDAVKLYSAIYKFRIKEYDAALEITRSISLANLNKNRQVRLLSLMGQINEKLGHFSEAFILFEKMNSVIQSKHEFSHENARTFMSSLDYIIRDIKAYSTDTETLHFTKPVERVPIFLIGFMRSGTTFLENVLSAHSKIETLPEVPIIGELWEGLESKNIKHILTLPEAKIIELRERYWEKAGVTNNTIQLIDKLPLNILYIPLCFVLFPNAKYIFSVRHPLDVVLSSFKQNFEVNAAMSVTTNIVDTAYLYDRVLEFYHECKQKLQMDVVEVRYEKLVANFDHEIRNLLTKLELEWSESVFDYQEQLKNKFVKTPSYHQVVEPVNTNAVFRYENYSKELQHIEPIVRKWINTFGYL